MDPRAAILIICAAIALSGCEGRAGTPPPQSAAPEPEPAAATEPAPPALAAAAPDAPEPQATETPAPPEGPRDEITLIAGGDVCLGKGQGQALLQDPSFDPFAPSAALLATADLRFINLESQISDQGGETQHPQNSMVFVAPPAAADALARARIDIVSAANNHMWDYGEKAFLETLGHLERVGVRYAGAGRRWKQTYSPVILERGGFRVAVLAVTDIWNDGDVIWRHPAVDRVAGANQDGIAATVRALRKRREADAIVVSYHGGVEYDDAPLPQTRSMARAAIDAGADAFIGHHPHVIHGIEMRGERPIFYSLGNFVMKMNDEVPETGLGMLARLRLRRGAPPQVEVCPVRSEGLGAVPLAGDPRRAETEAAFADRLQRVSRRARPAATVGAFTADGCAPVTLEATVARRASPARRRAP